MPARRMSEREYMDQVSRLFERVRAKSAATESEAILFERYRNAEFDLTVEYRLGPDFPGERREALRAVHWQAQEKPEKIRKEYHSGSLKQQEFVVLMQAAVDDMVKAYASVLSPEEMTSFFGPGEGAYKLPCTSDE